MANITFKGNPVNTVGELPAKGAAAPAFSLVDGSLADVKLSDFKGKNVAFNTLLWSDAPVKKNDIIAKSMNMPKKATITPSIKCKRSLFRVLSNAALLILDVEVFFLFLFVIEKVNVKS